MNKLLILVILFICFACILQMIAGFISMMYKGYIQININRYLLTLTSEHLWIDSLFIVGIIIILLLFSITYSKSQHF